MGIYIAFVSKDVRTVKGLGEVLISTHYGKAPGFLAADGQQAAFQRRCDNAEDRVRTIPETVQHVCSFKAGYVCGVAKWDGQAVLDDSFWDANTIGYAKKIAGVWTFQAEAE